MHANESKSFIVDRNVCLLVYIYVFLNGAGLSRDQCLVFNKNDKKRYAYWFYYICHRNRKKKIVYASLQFECVINV